MTKYCEDCGWHIEKWKHVCKKCWYKRKNAGKPLGKQSAEEITPNKDQSWNKSPRHVKSFHYRKNRKNKTGRPKHKYSD